MRRIFLALLLVLSVAHLVQADDRPDRRTDDAEVPLYYTVARNVTVFSAPDSARAYVRLRFREPVYLVSEKDGWAQIRTQDGAKGYVASSNLSNVWIRVSKGRKRVYLYRGAELLMQVPADFGYNVFADKRRRGSATNPDDWRTPEGVFSVVEKNPRSKYRKALVLNYPTAEDAERGLAEELITQREYEAIVRAEKEHTMPPMNTALGGWIEIHGEGTGVGANWTQGCVAVHNDDMDRLFQLAPIGTPVLIEP